MFDVADPLTLKLAPLLGAFMLASAIGFLQKKSRVQSYLRELSASAGISRAIGSIVFFVGGLIVLWHSDFTSAAASIVSALGIWWSLEGFALLLIPDRLPLRSEGTVNQFYYGQYFAALMGAFLLVAGLVGEASLLP